MPYVKPEIREWINSGKEPPTHPGVLNYQITTLLLDYLESVPISYQVLNDIIGALEAAKLEFYRRVVVPYEDEKIEENGDVY